MSLLRSKLVLFIAISCAHFMATGAALLAAFSASMGRFDSGRSPTLSESAIEGVFSILIFPVLPLIKHVPMQFPGFWGYLPFAVNSAIWSAAVCLILAALRQRKTASPRI